jgi:hypothetical protein
MTTPARFAYADTAASRAEGNLLAYVPITLSHETHVLPYSLGLQLGFVWE